MSESHVFQRPKIKPVPTQFPALIQMDLSESDEVMVRVDNLAEKINNEQLRGIFGPYGATKCRVVFRKGPNNGFSHKGSFFFNLQKVGPVLTLIQSKMR